MRKTFTLLALVASFGVAGCTNHVTDLPPGKYESTSKSTDANGTDYETERTTNVSVDRYGNKKAVVEKETSSDPKGLFNKSTSSKKTVVTE